MKDKNRKFMKNYEIMMSGNPDNFSKILFPILNVNQLKSNIPFIYKLVV